MIAIIPTLICLYLAIKTGKRDRVNMSGYSIKFYVLCFFTVFFGLAIFY